MKKSIIAIAFSAVLSLTAIACPMHGGKIASMDAASNRLTVAKGGDVATFRLPDDKTKLTIDGKPATFADLKVGDKINVNYDTNHNVVSVEVVRG